MKIAQIAPIIERIPPHKYGGVERMVHDLTEELVKRGHEVTLFASGNSQTSARLVSVLPRSMRELKLKNLYGGNTWSLYNLGLAYARQAEFDIIHDHMAPLSTATANLTHVPVVVTLHGDLNLDNRVILSGLNKPYLVSISDAQRIPAPHLNYIATVYHGLGMKDFPFSEMNDGYLLFVGRISYEKGVHFAIQAAQYLDLPLIIAAKLDQVDVPYYKQYVEPELSDQIKWIGEVTQEERNRLMSKALCFLHPVTWREPFGLVLIEAAATGCPVVAFGKGSIPELVVDGKTGFVVDSIEQMLDAIGRIKQIRRQDCRDYALTKFSVERMVDDYENVYRRILNI